MDDASSTAISHWKIKSKDQKKKSKFYSLFLYFFFYPIHMVFYRSFSPVGSVLSVR